MSVPSPQPRVGQWWAYPVAQGAPDRHVRVTALKGGMVLWTDGESRGRTQHAVFVEHFCRIEDGVSS
jgi:hypothetical protein